MNKKIPILLVLILSIGVMASCGDKNKESDLNGQAETGADSSNEEGLEEDNSNAQISDVIKVDKKFFSVEVTLPSSMVENPDSFVEKDYVEENVGVKSAHFNEDGSFTTVMSKKKHREIVSEMKEGLDKTIKEIEEDKNQYPHIKEIKPSKDYDKIKVKVDKEEYNEEFDLALYLLSMNIGIYQVYNGKEFYSEFEVYDVLTEDLIKTIIFPDDLED